MRAFTSSASILVVICCLFLPAFGAIFHDEAGTMVAPNELAPLLITPVTLSDLRHGANRGGCSGEVETALRTDGIIAVTGLGNDFKKLVKKAMGGFCRCLHEVRMEDQAHGFSGFGESSSLTPGMVESVPLNDGVTTRTTLATATVGETPLPLPSTVADSCGNDVADAMDALRDRVAHVSDTFMDALDAMIGAARIAVGDEKMSIDNDDHVLLRDTTGNEYRSLKSIVGASTNLEHFHIYHKNASETDANRPAALRPHTDLGLFLSFIPGMDCGCGDVSADQNSFLVSTYPASESTPQNGHNGADRKLTMLPEHHQPQHSADQQQKHTSKRKKVLRRAVFPEDSVVIMMGAGAEHWLNLPDLLPLRATTHAVKMAEDMTERVWYGRMHLVPESAIIDASGGSEGEMGAFTFGHLKELMSGGHHEADNDEESSTPSPLDTIRDDSEALLEEAMVTLGCGAYTKEHAMHPFVSTPFSGEDDDWDMLEAEGEMLLEETALQRRLQRRRLAMVASAESCSNSTNFYCWMSCLDIPDASEAATKQAQGEALYCLNPSVLSSSGGNVSQAVNDCTNAQGVVGGKMNPICVGSWQTEVEGVPSQQVSALSSEADTEEPFCYGSTSMFMQGFLWKSANCVVWLFPQAVMDSRVTFAFGCIGTLLLGILLEGIIFTRRKILAWCVERITTKGSTIGRTLNRVAWSAGMYGVQLTLGYFLMLLVMTYSGPIFMCVIFGLVIGHIVFNLKGPVPEGCTPCCQNDVEGPEGGVNGRPVQGSGRNVIGGNTHSACCAEETLSKKGSALSMSPSCRGGCDEMALSLPMGIQDGGRSACCDGSIKQTAEVAAGPESGAPEEVRSSNNGGNNGAAGSACCSHNA